MVKGGYAGKVLRVDLTTGKTTGEAFREEILRKYIGSFGLATKIMFDEVPPNVRPFDPENRVIFMTGPLTGTVAPSSSRHVVLTLNTEVPKVMAPGYAGGFWAAYLKFSGYDGIIIQGAAKDPVYLWVHDDSAEILDAKKYWGKDTHETEDLIKKEIGDRRTSVSTIGPAGETLSLGSVVSNDKRHISSKGGAILGSKKLKAIAVGGGKRIKVPMADEQMARKLTKEWREAYDTSGNVRRNKGGNLLYWGHPKYFGENSPWILLVKNLSDPEFAYLYGKGLWDLARVSKVTPYYCYNCNVGCNYDCEIGSGPYKGTVVTITGGAENYEGLGGNIGVTDGGTVIYLTDLQDRLGFDAATVGSTIALAYECYEKGLITKEDTDGLELKWGNADAAIKLLHKIIRREGFGAVLADGPKEAAKRISKISGKDAMKYCTHIKGGGWIAHDFRMSWETMLGQYTCPFGPVIHGLGPYLYREPDLEYPRPPKPYNPEEAPIGVRTTQLKKVFEDCLGVCWYITGGVPRMIRIAPKMLSAVTGWDFTWEEAKLVGERIVTLGRVFALRRGLRLKDDLDVGPRLLEAPIAGPGKGHPIEPYLENMVKGYYKVMGWDEETGVPTEKTLERLNIKELKRDVKALRI